MDAQGPNERDLRVRAGLVQEHFLVGNAARGLLRVHGCGRREGGGVCSLLMGGSGAKGDGVGEMSDGTARGEQRSGDDL